MTFTQGELPYITHMVMCYCGGYGFQPDWYRIWYKNQAVLVLDAVSLIGKLGIDAHRACKTVGNFSV